MSVWSRETPFVAWLPTMARRAMWTTPFFSPVMMAVRSLRSGSFGKAPRHLDEEPPVDLPDDLEVARKEMTHELVRPGFERFRQDSVVRVADGAGRDLPCIVPLEALFVHEDPHELGDRDGRVGIVQLNGDLFGKGVVGLVELLVSAEHVAQGGCHEEVLLLEAELLAREGIVVRDRGPSRCSRCCSCPPPPSRSRRC